MTKCIFFSFVILVAVGVACSASAADIEESTIKTKLVPSPVGYTVLLPPGYNDADQRYPLFLFLHGGGGDNGFLRRVASIFREEWAAGNVPEMIVATPNANRSFYLDYRDGSQKWETFIVQELIPHVRKQYRVRTDKDNTFVGGISMGGMGSLRMGFKHLDTFGAIVAMEPGIEPAFAWEDVELRDKFWRSPRLLAERYGDPFDEAYWAANNPATIARDNADAIKSSGIAIYLEVGTEDSFGLDRGTEFLHRVLYDHGIAHEYRLVRGADHIGNSMPPRIRDAIRFLDRVMNPLPPDPTVETLHKQIDTWKRQAGLEEVER